jgi:hypothetical protein
MGNPRDSGTRSLTQSRRDTEQSYSIWVIETTVRCNRLAYSTGSLVPIYSRVDLRHRPLKIYDFHGLINNMQISMGHYLSYALYDMSHFCALYRR